MTGVVFLRQLKVPNTNFLSRSTRLPQLVTPVRHVEKKSKRNNAVSTVLTCMFFFFCSY